MKPSTPHRVFENDRTDVLADKIAGYLIGTALGDAVGFICERQPRAAAWAQAIAYRNGAAAQTSRKDKEGAWKFGQISDDTVFSRLVLRHIAKEKWVDGAKLAHEFLSHYNTHGIVGTGGSTRAFFKALDKGKHWQEAATTSGGNGAVMRAACVGIVFPKLAHAVEAAWRQAMVTHDSEEARAGAALVAAIAWRAARGGEEAFDIADIAATLAHTTTWRGLKNASMKIPHALLCDPERGRELMLGYIRDLDVKPDKTWDLISPYAVTTAVWAVYSHLYAMRETNGLDPIELAIETALFAGGDTDTTASIAAGLTGMAIGYERFGPLAKRYAELLNDRGDLLLDDLKAEAMEMAEMLSPRPTKTHGMEDGTGGHSP